MALKWKDKRDVCMLSSIHDAEMRTVVNKKGETKEKPVVCIEYNDSMGGVDLSDQCIVPYSTARKRMKKYYHKIFRHLLDITMFNSFVIYKKHDGKFTQLQFRIQIVQKLFHRYVNANPNAVLPVCSMRPELSDPSTRFSGKHFSDFNPPSKSRLHANKRCVVCVAKSQRRDTQYCCAICNVALCPSPCFRLYHTVEV